jgi:hypothetical protein
MDRKGNPRLGMPPQRPGFRPGPGQRRRRILAAAVSGGVNVAVLAALLGVYAESPLAPAKSPASTTLVNVQAQPKPPGPAEGSDADPGVPLQIEPPPLPHVSAPVVNIARAPASDTSDLLSESQIAGATRAGNGGSGGGTCDMAQAVQRVLRRDPRVRAAVESADRLGKASMIWNGDWVQSQGQEGKGLAVVRQAIIWEVGFAPAACRNERMRGLMLLSLADGRTSFAIGASNWRWSDLLGLRGALR